MHAALLRWGCTGLYQAAEKCQVGYECKDIRSLPGTYMLWYLTWWMQIGQLSRQSSSYPTSRSTHSLTPRLTPQQTPTGSPQQLSARGSPRRTMSGSDMHRIPLPSSQPTSQSTTAPNSPPSHGSMPSESLVSVRLVVSRVLLFQFVLRFQSGAITSFWLGSFQHLLGPDESMFQG